MKHKNLLISIFVFSAFAIVSCGGNKSDGKDAAAAEKTERVRVKKLEVTTISRDVEYSTTLDGYERLNVAPSVTGNIEHIYVEVGDNVKSGQILLSMDRRQLNTAKLQFANAEKEMARIKALYESEAISQQVYDQTKLAFDTAKESLDFLDTNTTVKARFAGVISAKNYEDGELYSGQPILVLTKVDILKALVGIPESYIPVVKKGMQVNLTSEIYPEKVFPATVEIVYPTVDPSTHNFTVKLRIPNYNQLLRPGMYVKAGMSMGDARVMVVPFQSVLKLIGSNDRYVFVNDGGVARREVVQLGQRFDEDIEIISENIKPGDELVVEGQSRLIDGVKLDIVRD